MASRHELHEPGAALSAAVERLCSSRTFSRAPRAAAVLRFLAETVESGRDVKEYTIAVEVFGLADYDPRTNALVRVSVSKLRKLIARYYQSEGRADPSRVDIAKGSYIPVLLQQPEATRDDRRWWVGRGRLLGGFSAAALILAGMFIALWESTADPAAVALPETAAPRLAVSIRSVGPHPDEELAVMLSREVTERLSELGIAVAQLTAPAQGRDLARHAKRAGAHGVLEGTVTHQADRVSVVVRLASAHHDDTVWTSSYDSVLDDRETLARAAAAAFAKDLRLDHRGTLRALMKPPAANAEASASYVEGTQLLGTGEPHKIVAAVKALDTSLRADPAYAPAWAELARTWATLAAYGERPPREALPRARQAARRALELSPRLAEALDAMALVSVMADRNWAAAEGSIREAIDAAPRWPDARLTYAQFVLTPRRRFVEAAEQLRQALAIDEHRNELHSALAGTYTAMNKPESALPHIERARTLASTAPATSAVPGILAVSRGEIHVAIRHFEAGVSRIRTPWVLAHLGAAYARAGEHPEAERVLHELERLTSGTTPLEFERATILAALERRDEALDLLERACDNLSASVLFMAVDDRLIELRAEERFKALLRRMWLVEHGTANGPSRAVR